MASVDVYATHLICIGCIFIPLSIYPSLEDQFTIPKWITFYFFSAAIILYAILTQIKIVIPKSKILWSFFIALFGLYCLSCFFNKGSYENQLLDWLCFSVLTLAVCAINHSQKDLLKLLCTYLAIGVVPVLIVGFLQFLEINLLPNYSEAKYPASFFGSPNMTAEYIGVCIISFYIGLRRFSKSYAKITFYFLLIFSHLYLFILYNRTTLISIIVVNIFLYIILQYEKISKFLLTASTIIIATFLILNQKLNIVTLSMPASITQKNVPQQSLKTLTSYEKNLSISMRLGRYLNTLALIKEHWMLGIGPDNYEFGYYPYSKIYYSDPECSEDLILKSPHNGYLELMSENGVFASIIFIIFIITLIFQLKKTIGFAPDDLQFAFGVLIYFCSIACAAFPMENAFPFYISAISLGLILSKLPKIDCMKQFYINKFFLLFLASIIFGLSTLYVASNLYLAGLLNREKYSFVCDYFPSNWRACLEKAQFELEMKNYQSSEKTLKAVLSHTPNNFVAKRILASVYFSQDKLSEGCSLIKEYDLFFNSESSLHDTYTMNCK